MACMAVGREVITITIDPEVGLCDRVVHVRVSGVQKGVPLRNPTCLISRRLLVHVILVFRFRMKCFFLLSNPP